MRLLGPFVVITAALVLLSAIMVLFPTRWLSEVMQLVKIPFSFRAFILVMAGVNFGLSLFCESFMFPIIARWIGEWLSERQQKKLSRYQAPLAVDSTTVDISGQQPQGYGSHAVTDQGALQQAMAQPVNKKKKASVKIYKIVEDEMNAP